MNKISKQHRWYITAKERLEYSEKILSQRLSVRHKSHRDWPEIKADPPQRQRGN
jgi:hypothetical protein